MITLQVSGRSASSSGSIMVSYPSPLRSVGVELIVLCFAALWIATILILVRSIYRVIELQGGFKGAVASNEAAFMIFEGPMIILAVFFLTIFHPGPAFAGKWSTATWSLRQKKMNEKVPSTHELMGKQDHDSDA